LLTDSIKGRDRGRPSGWNSTFVQFQRNSAALASAEALSEQPNDFRLLQIGAKTVQSQQ
jgi:hypothetical protein